ncbi:MAG: hypothetical protein ACRCWL_00490, partial [Aeromonas sp.]
VNLLAIWLDRWLLTRQAKENQRRHDDNHSDPQGAFADRFGAASRVPQHNNGDKLPPATATTDMERE